MSTYLPYFVSIATALISGIAAYLVAAKHTSSEIDLLRKSNEHEIEKLMKQHELDIENIGKKHSYEMEKIETEHQHQMQLAEEQMKNELTKTLMAEFMGAMMGTPEMKDLIAKSMKQGGK